MKQCGVVDRESMRVLRSPDGEFVMNYVTEAAGLSRLLSRIKGRAFGVLTAFRGEYSYKENLKRNGKMRLDLYQQGLHGFYQLIGHFIENQGTEDEQDVVELSYLVVKPDDMDQDVFINALVKIGSRWDQESVLIGIPTESGHDTFLYSGDGSHFKIGSSMTLDKAGEFYSVMKSKQNVPFVFEGHRVPSGGMLSVMAMKKLEFAW